MILKSLRVATIFLIIHLSTPPIFQSGAYRCRRRPLQRRTLVHPRRAAASTAARRRRTAVGTRIRARGDPWSSRHRRSRLWPLACRWPCTPRRTCTRAPCSRRRALFLLLLNSTRKLIKVNYLWKNYLLDIAEFFCFTEISS